MDARGGGRGPSVRDGTPGPAGRGGRVQGGAAGSGCPALPGRRGDRAAFGISGGGPPQSTAEYPWRWLRRGEARGARPAAPLSPAEAGKGGGSAGAPARDLAAPPGRRPRPRGSPSWAGLFRLRSSTREPEGLAHAKRGSPPARAPRSRPHQPRESRLERGFIFKTTSRGAQAASNFPPCARGRLSALWGAGDQGGAPGG